MRLQVIDLEQRIGCAGTRNRPFERLYVVQE
jgi:hypothetical protein